MQNRPPTFTLVLSCTHATVFAVQYKRTVNHLGAPPPRPSLKALRAALPCWLPLPSFQRSPIRGEHITHTHPHPHTHTERQRERQRERERGHLGDPRPLRPQVPQSCWVDPFVAFRAPRLLRASTCYHSSREMRSKYLAKSGGNVTQSLLTHGRFVRAK